MLLRTQERMSKFVKLARLQKTRGPHTKILVEYRAQRPFRHVCMSTQIGNQNRLASAFPEEFQALSNDAIAPYRSASQTVIAFLTHAVSEHLRRCE